MIKNFEKIDDIRVAPNVAISQATKHADNEELDVDYASNLARELTKMGSELVDEKRGPAA
ncbi:hypothetical protein ACTXT7_002289 [Hymenolepis weldensis]